MWRSLLTDLESVLKGAKPADLIRVPKSGPASRGEDAAAFSEWLPYRAWIADRQVFVNLDALGFCLEVRPQSGADEEMARVLTALYAASPPGTGIQFHLYASPAIRAPLARYANLRVADDVVPELDTLGRAGRHTNIHRTMARRRAGHYLQGSRTSLLPAQSYLFRDYRLVVSISLPGSPENLSRLDELLLVPYTSTGESASGGTTSAHSVAVVTSSVRRLQVSGTQIATALSEASYDPSDEGVDAQR